MVTERVLCIIKYKLDNKFYLILPHILWRKFNRIHVQKINYYWSVGREYLNKTFLVEYVEYKNKFNIKKNIKITSLNYN